MHLQSEVTRAALHKQRHRHQKTFVSTPTMSTATPGGRLGVQIHRRHEHQKASVSNPNASSATPPARAHTVGSSKTGLEAKFVETQLYLRWKQITKLQMLLEREMFETGSNKCVCFRGAVCFKC